MLEAGGPLLSRESTGVHTENPHLSLRTLLSTHHSLLMSFPLQVHHGSSATTPSPS